MIEKDEFQSEKIVFLLDRDSIMSNLPLCFDITFVTIMMNWVWRQVELVVQQKIQSFFVLFAENSQILLKISVAPILLTFMHLVALNLFK